MDESDLEIVVAIGATVIGILGLYQNSHARDRTLRLTTLGAFTLICMILSGAFTLRALSMKHAAISIEQRKAAALQARLEKSSQTIEQLGARLQAALADDANLAARMESMRQDLTAIRSLAAKGVLAPMVLR